MPQPSRQRDPRDSPAEVNTQGRRILVVDDSEAVRDVIRTFLEKTGFEVCGEAADGREAIEKAKELKPNLIVLDLSMPGMNGIEVAKALRRCDSSAKIIFLTVYQDPDILATCLAAGGLGYVVKVLMDTDLIPAMHEALADRVFVSRFSYPPDVSDRKT